MAQQSKMNDLIRQNAPVTASTPEAPAADDAVNAWHRDSLREKQDARLDSLWARLLGAHQKRIEAEGDQAE